MSNDVRVGDKFGRWTVIREAEPKAIGNQSRRRRRVRCRCVCGVEKTQFVRTLKSGKATGCGSSKCRIEWEVRRALESEAAAFIIEAMAEAQKVTVDTSEVSTPVGKPGS